MTIEPHEQEEEDAAAAEAARIGGEADPGMDPAMRPVVEGGGGEAEGFELTEEELIEHASHGDQQSAHAILHHQGESEDAGDYEDDYGDADHERSAEYIEPEE